MRIKSTRGNRRGFSTVQVAVLLAAITVVCLGSFWALGRAANTSLTTTGTNVGNPSTLVTRFGS